MVPWCEYLGQLGPSKQYFLKFDFKTFSLRVKWTWIVITFGGPNWCSYKDQDGGFPYLVILFCLLFTLTHLVVCIFWPSFNIFPRFYFLINQSLIYSSYSTWLLFCQVLSILLWKVLLYGFSLNQDLLFWLKFFQFW